jgi:steroid delta-isomerase-like uncharacterized protein
MPAETAKALVRRWFESSSYRGRLDRAMMAGDPKTAREVFFRTLVDEIFAPDSVMHFPDGDGSTDRILRSHLLMMDAFPDLSFVIDDLIAENSRVAVRGRMTGTNTGPFHGHPPTGKRVTMGYITICRIHNGKIAESWGYNDMPGLMRQLGTGPAGPG